MQLQPTIPTNGYTERRANGVCVRVLFFHYVITSLANAGRTTIGLPQPSPAPVTRTSYMLSDVTSPSGINRKCSTIQQDTAHQAAVDAAVRNGFEVSVANLRSVRRQGVPSDCFHTDICVFAQSIPFGFFGTHKGCWLVLCTSMETVQLVLPPIHCFRPFLLRSY